MQINISTRHGNLGAQSQEKITDKVMKLTRFHERLTSTTVTIDLENEERPGVEIQVTAEKARRFVASNTSESLMNSVDAALHKLEQQLKKANEQRRIAETKGMQKSNNPHADAALREMIERQDNRLK